MCSIPYITERKEQERVEDDDTDGVFNQLNSAEIVKQKLLKDKMSQSKKRNDMNGSDDSQELERAKAQAKAKEWAGCVLSTAQKWARSNETAELVVKASFGECAAAENEYDAAVRRVFSDPLRLRESPDEATLVLRQEKFRRALSEAALAAVVKVRLAS